MQRPIELFDSHCHLQDPRIAHCLPQLLESASHAGVKWFAVNGTCEGDWEVVKKMGEQHHGIIPCFGLHPWYVEARSANWLGTLRSMLDAVPGAALGEAGLDKGARGRSINLAVQMEVFKQQLALAKELQRPVAVHCVRAFGELHETFREMGPFPEGVILHSYLGSTELVKPLAKYGAFFSFSGFLTSMKSKKAEKMLREVPMDRILLETDCPDGLPQVDPSSLMWIPSHTEAASDINESDVNPHTDSNDKEIASESQQQKALNHPANINSVLTYVSSILGMREADVAATAYNNAVQLFSYPGSKVVA